MYNQTIPTTILSTIIALATMGIASDANAGGEDKCGNGYINWGEECDDGNDYNTDSCTNECKHAECGDGFKWKYHEECDDGNESNTDYCTNECEEPKCGDGYVQGDEECDDGNESNTDYCTNECEEPKCGDGYVQGDEECDDGNTVDDDHCSNTCEEPKCGDGEVQGDEECDDGNECNTDDCTTECKHPVCGDGYVQGDEQCDGGDHCKDDCTIKCDYPHPDDHDGVCEHDKCPGTTFDYPSEGLGVNRWALLDDDDPEDFDTVHPNGKGPDKSYTIQDTAGCSCKQIIKKLNLGEGHKKHGCSISAMDDWVDYVADFQPAPIGGELEFDVDDPEAEVIDAELDLSSEPQANGCNFGQTGNGPLWAFLGLVLTAAVGRRRWA
jgi:uncharacterized protein (TIGR03382 family)